MSSSSSPTTTLLPSHGRGMRSSRGMLARCLASARAAAAQGSSLSSSAAVGSSSALKAWPGAALSTTTSSRSSRRRHSVALFSASPPPPSSSSLHRFRGLSAKATAATAEGGDGGDSDSGALTVMGRVIDTELKDEAEKSYIAVRKGGGRERIQPHHLFFFSCAPSTCSLDDLPLLSLPRPPRNPTP